MNQKQAQNTAKPVTQSGSKRPNETGTIRVEGFLRIFDPKTQQTFLETRA
jgi:hypothetical protein